MKIRVQGGLPYVTASLSHNGRTLELDWVILDTASGSSVFSADELLRLGIEGGPDDRVRRITGVGGQELVLTKRIEGVALGEMKLRDLEVQIGAMNYGFPIQGILGLDFLLRVRAVIDLDSLEIFARQ
jgi:predicted aspartyl protease